MENLNEINDLDAIEVDLCGHLDNGGIVSQIGRCSEVIFRGAVGVLRPVVILCEEFVGEFVELTIGD